MIIDNEGLDIFYKTIQNIYDSCNYGDIIITYQDRGVNRSKNREKAKKFLGCDFEKNLNTEQLHQLYVKQLKKIGYKRIESVKIKSESGFFYSLLFCCRKEESKWLDMIKNHRERFNRFDSGLVKTMWDTIYGSQKRLDNFWNTSE